MTAVGWPLNAVSGAPAYTGRALRAASLAPLLAGATAARPLGARSGVRPGTPATTVSVAGMTWTVKPHAGILDVQAAETGPYGYAVTPAETGAVNAAHATYTRWDGIYVQISDPSEGDGTSTPGVAVVYVAGTPSASPAMPAAPARSLLLARIVVPQSGGGSPSVVWLAPPCGSADGVAWFATEADRDTLIPVAQRRPGMKTVVDSGSSMAEYTWNGATWRPVQTGWQTYTPSFTNFTLGNGTAVGRWIREGDRVTVEVVITLGSTSSVTGVLGVGLPVATAGNATGVALLTDSGSRFYAAVARTTGVSSSAGITTADGSGIVNTTSPFTWTASDIIQFTISYRVA